MLADIEAELEDSCDCFTRAMEIAKEYFPDDKELYGYLLAGREHTLWIAKCITTREPGVIADCEQKR